MGAKLTAKGRATRSRIVEGAAEVLREKGVATATLEDVMARTSTSKSQLFHYFPAGKDELLLAVARFEADQVIEDQQPELGRLDSWEAWERWRDVVVERYEAQGDTCPLGSLFLQVGRSTISILLSTGRSTHLRAALDQGIEDLRRAVPPLS
ncbi:TetR/AcrR family transcriptional regulator [Streptomyces sp900105245]|uniref:TetR/AcrR family transcriptional regulator n=1 Tax=Streptomyces sp. 900105245 TaxID=3154379 RepID=UPI003331A840